VSVYAHLPVWMSTGEAQIITAAHRHS